MKYVLVVLLGVVLLSSCEQNGNSEVSLSNFQDSSSYAVGTSIGLNLISDFKSQGIDSSFNIDLVVAGLSEAIIDGETMMSKEEAKEVVDNFFVKLNEELSNKNMVLGTNFLAENASKPGVVTTESGLQYIILKEGSGNSPSISDEVKVHYTGKLLNGNVFDSSEERNEPVKFFVRSVIPGWTEALQLMKPGSEFKLFIPSRLAYGEKGGPRGSGIRPNEVLIFDVKLIEVISK